MSKEDYGIGSNASANEVLLFLDPAQITEPEATNVRPWSSKVGDTEAEIERITRLAATIEEEGQIQPVRVRAAEDGMYELIAGRRRKKAIELINAGRKTGQELKVKAVMSDVNLTDPSAFRQAAIENWHREGLSPMDMAMDIATVRSNFKLEGSKGTKKVAEFFKVSPATINQHETLLKLPEDLQQKVHVGELTRDNAFMLAAIAQKQGPDAAKAVADEAAAAGAAVEAEADGVIVDHAHETPAEAKKRKSKKKAAAVAKTKVIKKAARAADPDKAKARTRTEIMEFFTSCYGPAYGHPNGAVHMFVDALEKFAAGSLSDRTLYKYFDAMVEKAPKGSAEKVVAVKVETAVEGKSKKKAAKKK